MKIQIFTLSLLCASALGASGEVLDISTPSTSLVLNAVEGSPLKIVYYGERLAPADLNAIHEATGMWQDAYPAYGYNPKAEAALSVTHSDGYMATDLAVSHTARTTRPDGSTLTTVTMTDRNYPFTVDLFYLTRPGSDVIETWTAITSDEKKPVTLNRFMSGYLPVRQGDVWLSSLYGSWANETQLTEEPLPHGVRMIKNKDGVRNSHTAHAEVMLSLDGRPSETSGRTIGAALCYPGNYKIFIDTDDGDYHHLFAGINEENSAYQLKKGETFTTPVLAFTYSPDGLGGVSRNFHSWGRKYQLHNGSGTRPVLLNSWEGCYFDINEPTMAGMMADIADMGGELFVMDDGWFGDKYPRNVDNSSLGDWVVDTRKLPHGINGLLDTADSIGVKFGIWIEPEMTNTASELCEAHPDWVIKAPALDNRGSRGSTQLVLDMANPAVQDFVFNIVDTLLTSYPRIAYIKWDANDPVNNAGSQYLTSDRQSHLYIDYHKGLLTTLERIRAAHPDVIIQACASGGGRANWGLMPYFDEFWTSDNNDALQRIYMQWGTSYFFPAVAMGSHISASPNHQTFRRIPAKFRADVAMSGRLGLEMQPKNMTDDERRVVRRAIEDYKKVRHIIQQGDLYRLLSPFDRKGVASLMYVTPEKDDAVFFWWKTETFMNQQLPRVTLDGLDPDRLYTVTELNPIDRRPLAVEGKTYSGRYLMANGLPIPNTHDVEYHQNTDYASRVIRLTAKE